MEREFSAGGAVVRCCDGRWWLAVIEPQSSGDRAGRRLKPRIALPKGLRDNGERPEQTALREVREETGVEANLVTKLSDIRYSYLRAWSDGQRVFKVVTFYLLLYRSGELGNISEEMRVEVRRAEWMLLEEAVQRLTHRGERDVARAALAYLTAHPELAESMQRSAS